MSTTHNSMLLLICGLLSGCVSIDSITESYKNSSLTQNRQYRIPQDDDTDLVVRPGWIQEMAAKTPRGSLVNVVTEDDDRLIGILANIDGDVLELTRCLHREIVDAPDGEKQCQCSYFPSQSLKFSSLKHFNDITHIVPSPNEFRRRAIHQSDRNSAIDSIVLKSGRPMHIPDRTLLEHETRTAEQIGQDLSHVRLGSEICVIDESGRCMNAIVLEVGTENVELMSRVTQEMVFDSRGRPQMKTTHAPFETLKVSAMTSFRVIAAPPPGAEVLADDIDCNACAVDAFVARNGNRYCWGDTYSLNAQR